MQPRPCLFTLQGAFRDAASQKPLRATKQAKQDGELDLRRVTRFSPGAFLEELRPRGTRHRPTATHRLSSTLALQVGSLGWLLRMRNPRSPAQRPIKANEVEPLAHVRRYGIVSPDQDPPIVLALKRLSSAPSSPRRAEVGSTAIHDRHLPGDYVNILSVVILSDIYLIKPPPLSRYSGGEAPIILRRSAGRRTPVASAADDTPCGRSSLPTPIGLSSCRACVLAAASISWPRAWLAASGKPLRRRPT